MATTTLDDAPPADNAADAPGIVGQIADFPEFTPRGADAPIGTINHLFDVSVCVTAELGRMNLSVAEILKLGIGSVVSLDRTVSEPVDLLVQGVPFARGEVVVIEDRFAIRIREILDPKQAGKK
jgi:flagellar motor switch protein FliN/FliY